MNEELQIGKYQFYPYEFIDERETLLKELELLLLGKEQREIKIRDIRRKLATVKNSKVTVASLLLQ
jgi:hypothetical protein